MLNKNHFTTQQKNKTATYVNPKTATEAEKVTRYNMVSKQYGICENPKIKSAVTEYAAGIWRQQAAI